MLYTLGDDIELPGLQCYGPVFELQAEHSFQYEKEFVFVWMMMPDEVALYLGQLHLLAVQRSHYPRVPVIEDGGEFLFQIHSFPVHRRILSEATARPSNNILFWDYSCPLSKRNGVMHCFRRFALALIMILPVGILPGALSAQAIIDLPDRDRPLTVEVQDLYSVGSMAGDDWEMFSRVTGVAFDGTGNLYILDADNYRVVKVDPRGGLLTEMGRGGEGPGEFGMPLAFSVTHQGEVRVFDLGKQGFTLFNPDGSFKTTVPMGGGGGMFVPTGGLLPHPGGGMVSGGAGGMRVSIGSGGGQVDANVRRVNLFELKSEVEMTTVYEGWNPAAVNASGRVQTTSTGTFQISAPPMRAFDPELMTGILPDGRIAIVDSTSYEVKILELGQGVVQRFRRPIYPRAVTRRDREAEKDRQLEEMAQRSASGGVGGTFVVMSGSSSGGGATSGRISVPDISAMMEDRIQSMEFGGEIPVIAGLSADWVGHLWLERTGSRVGEEGPIDVLSGEGSYLGTLAPGEFQIPDAFGPDGLAAYIETDEMDVPRVVVKRLILR